MAPPCVVAPDPALVIILDVLLFPDEAEKSPNLLGRVVAIAFAGLGFMRNVGAKVRMENRNMVFF